MDLSKSLSVVRRYLWLFLLSALVASFTTFVVFKSRPVLFEAKTRLLVGPGIDSPSPDLNSLRIGGQLTQTYAELVNTRPFLESVNSKLDQKIDPESLGGLIETKQNNETRILTIIVQHQDPKQAVAIANAVAETIIEVSPSIDNSTALLRTQISQQSHSLEEVITKSETSIQNLEAKLIALENAKGLSPETEKANLEQQNIIIRQLAEERARLSDALRTLATIYDVLRDTNTNQINIVEPAVTVLPVDQQIPLRAAASGLAGLILAICIIFALDYFDDTIRSPRDFKRIANVPLLITIDKHNRLDGSGLERVITFAQPESRAANSYHTAAAKLLFSAGKSIPHTFLLSSAGSRTGDDTAEIVANLGVALARAGNRVILVDAQFQNPLLTELFEAEGKAGLADLLVTDSPRLKLLPVKEVPGIQLLPTGLSSEKGSGTILNSVKVAGLVEEMQKEADIVLFAGSPLSWYSESLSLASLLNSVILVARHGEAHSKIFSEVVESLHVMNIRPAGVIYDHLQSPFGFKLSIGNVFEDTSARSDNVPKSSLNLKTTDHVEKS
jgi:capsular polysaccharide biosynthesis protein